MSAASLTDLGYFPGNVTWATPKQQARNRRITAFRETFTLAGWAEKTGVHMSTIRSRLERGWTMQQALSIPTAAPCKA